MSIEVELSDGTVLEVPDGTSNEAIKNYAARAEARIKGGRPVTGPETRQDKADQVDRERFKISDYVPLPSQDTVGRAATGALFGIPDLLLFGANMGARYAGAPEMPYLSDTVNKALGIKPQDPNAGYVSRIGENLLSTILSPADATRSIAQTALPYAQRVARPIANLADRVAQRFFPNAAPVIKPLGKVTGDVAQAAGSVAGEDIGRAYGGDAGGVLGALAGGMTLPAVNAVTNVGTRAAFAKRGGASTQALNDLEQAGITPRPGLVGNRGMARIENTAAGIPIIGVTASNRQQQGFNQFNDAFYDTTADAGRTVGANEGPTGTYGPTQAPMPESPEIIGARIRDAARQGETNLTNEFNRRYQELERGIPTFTLVDPQGVRGEARSLSDPFTGEGAAVGGRAREVIETHIDPAVRTVGSYSEYGPVVSDTGIPFQVARPTRTSMRYEGEGQAPMGEGAHNQLGQAFTDDMERALFSSPEMIRAYPDPSMRQEIIERYRTADREYRQENDPTLSRSVPPTMPDGTPIPGGGGAFPALTEMQNPATERGALAAGTDPGRLAVLQRTNPDAAGPIGADIMVQKSQAATPFADVTIDPTKLKWWAALSPNEKLIYANNRPDIVERMDNLSRVGNLFNQRSFTDNRSNTAPMLTTIAGGTAAIAAPGTALPTGLGLYAASLGVSSDTLARYLGRTNPQMLELLLRKGVNASALAGQTAGNAGPGNANPFEGLPTEWPETRWINPAQ